MRGLLLSLIITLILATSVSASYDLEIVQEGDRVSFNESFVVNGLFQSNILPYETIDSSGRNYYFTYNVLPKTDSDITIRMFLDDEFEVNGEDIYPKNYDLETDGRSIIITWHFDNLPDSKDIPLFVKLEGPSQMPIALKIIIAIVALVVIFFSVIFFLNYGKKIEARNKVNTKKNKKEDFSRYLAEGERRVVEILRDAEEREMWQKDIQRESEFSKAKLSRIIRNLESRNIITRNPIGNTNKIKLKK